MSQAKDLLDSLSDVDTVEDTEPSTPVEFTDAELTAVLNAIRDRVQKTFIGGREKSALQSAEEKLAG